MLFQPKKLPEIINLTRFLKSFWILYIDQIIVYNTFYSTLTFYINKRSLSDARPKSFSFASVATATQIILATLPLYSQNATWRSSTANTDMISHIFIASYGRIVAISFGFWSCLQMYLFTYAFMCKFKKVQLPKFCILKYDLRGITDKNVAFKSSTP